MDNATLETSENPIVGPHEPLARGGLRRTLAGGYMPILLLAAATLAAHGRGLLDGLFLDDHLHISRYQTQDWSIRHLLDATTIEPGEFMESWWQDQPIRWQYARPFSVLLAKAVYHLSGGSVKALHALSVGLHFLAAVLVFYLCRALTRRPGWALIGGLLFVIHSHSVYAVGWLAAQNCVLQTVLTLAALLSYIRASGLDVYAGKIGADTGGNPRRAGCQMASSHRPDAPLAKAWFAAGVVFWALALFSRENALVLPAFAAAFDLAFGGFRHLKRRVPVYAFMAVIAVVFALWRLKFFYHPMPAFYVRAYDGPAYILWWLAKLLHYITGVVWLSPLMLGPSTRFNPFSEVPGDCVLMIAIIAIMGTGYYLACRRARGWWIWPLWILLSLLPVVPVFAAPHSAYMPAVGFAVAMILGPALRHEIQPLWIGRWSPTVAIWFLIATTTYMPIYHTFWSAVQTSEQLTISQMAADPPRPDTTDVFLVNLPFVNIYTRLHLAENLPSRPNDFRCHALTYSSNVLRMEEDCRLEQIDPYEFRLSTQGRGYFSSALGRFLIESMHPSGRFHAGDVIRRELFDVTISRADEQGVQELQFRFRKPLASPEYCFYLTTNQQAAVRVHFWGPERSSAKSSLASDGIGMTEVRAAAEQLNAGESRAAAMLFAAMDSDDSQIRSAAVTEFRPAANAVSRALAAPVEGILSHPTWSKHDQALIKEWWGASVDDRILQVAWVHRAEWEPLQRQRDRLFRIQRIANRIIQTDLYMTGPPFPGPR